MKTNNIITIVSICAIVFFLWLFRTPPVTLNERNSIIDSLTAQNAILRFKISQNKDSIVTLFKVETKIRNKYDTIYRNLDSITYDEILFEYEYFDDTAVNYDGSDLIKFRLVQGVEAVAMNEVHTLQIEQYKQIVDRLFEVSKRDSIMVFTLIADNNRLSTENMQLRAIVDENNKGKVKRVGYIALSGVVGVFSGLILKR